MDRSEILIPQFHFKWTGLSGLNFLHLLATRGCPPPHTCLTFWKCPNIICPSAVPALDAQLKINLFD